MKLWKDNRLTGEWELSMDEILDRFEVSPIFAEETGRPFEFVLAYFIGANESEGGLQSVNDKVDYDVLLDKAYGRGMIRRWVERPVTQDG